MNRDEEYDDDDGDDEESSEGENSSGDDATTSTSTYNRSASDASRKQSRGNDEGVSTLGEDEDLDGYFYPQTGHIHLIGGSTSLTDQNADAPPPERHPACGKVVNVPWPTTGFGDLEYYVVLQELLAPMAREFDPEMVLISCGFDCAAGDLLGSMNVSPTGFYYMTRLVMSLCSKVVVALEGGYNVSQVAKGSEAVLRALLSATVAPDSLPRSTMLSDRLATLINDVKKIHAPFWECFRTK
jgi:hypothetical protein